MRVRSPRKLSTKEPILLSCGVGILSRVPWTARSNQLILKEIDPEHSLEGLIQKLKLQYFGQVMWRTDSQENTLMLVKTEGGRRRGRQRTRWLDGITDSVDMSLSELRGLVMAREAWRAAIHGVAKSQTRLRLNWTVTKQWQLASHPSTVSNLWSLFHSFFFS